MGGPMKKLLITCMIAALLAIAYVACDESTTEPEPQPGTVTFNLSAPVYEDEDINGAAVAVSLWSEWGANTPIKIEDGVFSGSSVTLQIPDVEAGTYIVVAAIDIDGNGLPDDGPFDEGDLFWAALDVAISGDKTIDVSENAWQRYAYNVLGVEDMPSGHDGEVFFAGMIQAGGSPFGEDVVMGGVGLIYNNSAVIALWPMDYDDSPWTLPAGEYEIWCLIDVDGTLDNYYQDIGDSTAFSPLTDGDYYMEYDYDFTAGRSYDDFIRITGDFSPVVGISGTVSCPDWNGGGGGTYVYLFGENPIVSDSAQMYSYAALTQPGSYWVPCMAGDSVYVVGLWDTDNSGEWDGPSQDDLVGGYGTSVDSLETVIGTELGVSGIDFVLDTPYDTTQMGGGR